mgnify:CR=1 FL=1
MEVVIALDEPPYERILDVDANPSPGRAPDRSGAPGDGGPGYPASPNIRGIRFDESDPVEEDRGDEVSQEFFSRHEDEIVEGILENMRERARREPPRARTL